MVFNRWSMSNPKERCSSLEAFTEAKTLDKEFLDYLSKSGPLDSHVQGLSRKIRDCYESIILKDHEFAEDHEVERCIWLLHYKQICEFRHRIDSIKGLSQVQDLATKVSICSEGPKMILRREPIIAGFKSFLDGVSNFYVQLMCKLRARCGLSFDLSDDVSTEGVDERKALDLKRCEFYCHTCLIRLGDCARYMETYVGNNNDFSAAVCFYRKALSLSPADGQPHNQFAMLASCAGDILLAVYHHFRSLSVKNPFLLTRESLKKLFIQLQNQFHPAKDEEILAASQPKGTANSSAKATQLDLRSVSMLSGPNNFFVGFVYLAGLVFTGIRLGSFGEMLSSTLLHLDQLLQLDDEKLEEALRFSDYSGTGSKDRGEAGALKVIFILICSIENVTKNCQPKESQREVRLDYAIIMFVEITRRLMQRCMESCGARAGDMLLPATLVALEWLACETSVAWAFTSEKQLNAWSSFWKQCVSLLNKYCDTKNDNVEAFLSDETGSNGGAALWEDHELQGFLALAAAHTGLDFTREDSADDHMEVVYCRSVRLIRLIAAGKTIASELGNSCRDGSRMLYDNQHGSFCLVEENYKARTLESNGFTFEDESEDEDELIVFKPSLQDASAVTMCRLSGSTQTLEPTGTDTGTTNRGEQIPEFTQVSDLHEMMSGIEDNKKAQNLVFPSNLRAGTEHLNTGNLPLWEDVWQIRAENMNGTGHQPDLIGQPKQLQSCTDKAGHMIPSQTLTNLVGLTCTDLTSAADAYLWWQSRLIENVSTSEEERILTTTSPDIIASLEAILSSPDEPCSRPLSTVVRPPPGFGPRPLYPPMKTLPSAKGCQGKVNDRDTSNTHHSFSRTANVDDKPRPHIYDYSLWTNNVIDNVPAASRFSLPEYSQYSQVWKTSIW